MKGKICVTGIKAEARHGVYDFEAETPHPFIADIVLYREDMPSDDQLSSTVDYEKAVNIAYRVLTEERVNLIETLAYRAAFELASTFGCDADVIVHKPEAPLSRSVFDVSVTACAKYKKVCLSLGSNMGERAKYLDDAVQYIKQAAGNKDVRVSSYMKSAPYGGVADGEFLNACLIMHTLKSPRELLLLCAEAEKRAGRVRKERWGNRTLDIDIIFYGDEIIDEADLTVPHIDMCNREFVLAPLCEIAPGFVHPVYGKTAKQLLEELRGRRE